MGWDTEWLGVEPGARLRARRWWPARRSTWRGWKRSSKANTHHFLEPRSEMTLPIEARYDVGSAENPAQDCDWDIVGSARSTPISPSSVSGRCQFEGAASIVGLRDAKSRLVTQPTGPGMLLPPASTIRARSLRRRDRTLLVGK